MGFHWQAEAGESVLGWTAAQHPKLAWGRHPPVCGPGWAMSSLPLQELKGPGSYLGFLGFRSGAQASRCLSP